MAEFYYPCPGPHPKNSSFYLYRLYDFYKVYGYLDLEIDVYYAIPTSKLYENVTTIKKGGWFAVDKTCPTFTLVSAQFFCSIFL